jgi:hypothetical protein
MEISEPDDYSDLYMVSPTYDWGYCCLDVRLRVID